jgi:nucleoside-diphosphate-sugar epimerase
MKVALFGAGGFLGRAVARELTARGHEAAALTRADADIEVPDALARLELDADSVINCAARVPSGPSTLAEQAAMFAANAVGAAQVAQWAVSRGIRRIVHGSTLVVVARPWPVPLTEDAPTYPLGPVAGYAASKLGG